MPVTVAISPALSFTNRTTANGLGSNIIRGVYGSGSTVYAATDGGLGVSTNGGTTFTNRATGNGLGDSFLYGVYAVGSNVAPMSTSAPAGAVCPSPPTAGTVSLAAPPVTDWAPTS